MARRAAAEGSTLRWPSPRYREDPVAFARDILGVEPWEKQIEILEALRDNTRVAVKSGHKVAKTHSLAIAALWFFSSYEDARVVCTCVTARQIDEIFYRETRKLHAKAGHCVPCAKESAERVSRHEAPLPRPCAHSALLDGEPRELARSGIKTGDFREIVGFTAKQKEAVAGTSGANLLYLVDEASGVDDEIFEAIEGNRAGGSNAKILLTSNPTRTDGRFYEAFRGAGAKFFKQITISSEETPNVREGRVVVPGLATREWVEEKREEWGEKHPLYIVRVKGEFVEHEAGKILSLHRLGEAEARWAETADDGAFLQIGVDPAGPGEEGDESAFSARRGLKHLRLDAKVGLTDDGILAHTIDLIASLRRPREKVVVTLDREGSVGADTYAKFRAYVEMHPEAFELYGVRAGQPASRNAQVYEYLRDELWENLSRWLEAGGSIIQDAKLLKELHAPSWIPLASFGPKASKLRATDKKTLRKMLDRSPDRADALCLSVWEPRAFAVAQNGAGEAVAVAPAQAVGKRVELDAPAVETTFDPYAALHAWGGR